MSRDIDIIAHSVRGVRRGLSIESILQFSKITLRMADVDSASMRFPEYGDKEGGKMTLEAKILLILDIGVLAEGLTYFFSLPSSKFRAWLKERRERWWMRMWPPAQWALDQSESAS
jgi:hypothetical protein